MIFMNTTQIHLSEAQFNSELAHLTAYGREQALRIIEAHRAQGIISSKSCDRLERFVRSDRFDHFNLYVNF
jgi:hypothetical protein